MGKNERKHTGSCVQQLFYDVVPILRSSVAQRCLASQTFCIDVRTGFEKCGDRLFEAVIRRAVQSCIPREVIYL